MLGSSEEGREWIFPEPKILELHGFNFTFFEGKYHTILPGMLFEDLERGLQQRTAASGAPLIAVHWDGKKKHLSRMTAGPAQDSAFNVVSHQYSDQNNDADRGLSLLI